MQTTGAALLAAKRCSLAWVRSAAQDGHSVCGLLYFAAVRADWREQEHRQEAVDTDPSLVSYRLGVGYRRSPGNLASRVTRSIGECRMSLVSTRKSCERARRHSAWRSLAATPVTVLLIRGSAVRRRLGPGAEVLGAGVPGQEPAECLAGQGLSVVAAAFIEVGGQVGDDVQPGQLGSRDDGPDTGGGPGGARVMGAASILPGHDRCPDRALGQVIVLRGLHLTGAAQVSALPRESAWRGRLPA